MLDVLIVSLGSTGGLRAADEELLASLRRAGARAQIAAATGPRRATRTLALTDFLWALAARRAARAALAREPARALIYSTTTAALLWPRPGAIRFDALAAANRPGRHGLWQRRLERRRLREATLLLPQDPGALAEGGSGSAACAPRRQAETRTRFDPADHSRPKGGVRRRKGGVFGLEGGVFGLKGGVFGLKGRVFGLKGSSKGRVFGLEGRVFGLQGGAFGLQGGVFVGEKTLVLPVPVEPSAPVGGQTYVPRTDDPTAGSRQHRRDIAAIVYAANPHKKGLDVLLQAWARARRPGEQLYVAGVAESELRRLGYVLPADGVRVTGPLPPAPYRALLRRTRVYVCAARREDYGIAQLEALADGCLLVTVPSPGPYAALPLARALDARLVGDELAAMLRTALDDPSPDYAERALAALAPFRRAAVDRIVSDELLPRLLAESAP